MLQRILRTSDSYVDTVVRIALAVVFFPHGAQKVLGWFGGHGLSATLNAFTNNMGIPYIFAVLAIAAEFLGSIGLFLGLLTRVAAFGILCVMVVATTMVHARVGFFMNWMGQYPAGTEGFEFHILAIALAFSALVRGAGPASVDRSLSWWR